MGLRTWSYLRYLVFPCDLAVVHTHPKQKIEGVGGQRMGGGKKMVVVVVWEVMDDDQQPGKAKEATSIHHFLF